MKLNKTYLIIILAALATFLVVGLVIYVMARPNQSPTDEANGDNPIFFGESGDRAFPATPPPSDTRDQLGNNSETAPRFPNLWRVSNRPVVASTFYSQESESEPARYIRYLERATGHVYEQNLSLRTPIRLSNTTVPRIQNAFWLGDEDRLVLQYLTVNLERTETFYGALEQKDDELIILEDSQKENAFALAGSFLESNITSIAGAPDSNSVFYLVKSDDGGSTGKVRTESGDLQTLYRSPHGYLQTNWPTPNTITVTSNASALIPGFHYFVNSNTGSERIILFEEYGLTALTNRDASRTLYYTAENGVALNYLHQTDELDTSLVPITTLPEKCVWSPVELEMIYCAAPGQLAATDMPDAWYQGRVGFSDFLWQINTETMTTEILASPRDFYQAGGGTGVDVIDMQIDPDGRYLSFINKQDLSLWALMIPQTEPERIIQTIADLATTTEEE